MYMYLLAIHVTTHARKRHVILFRRCYIRYLYAPSPADLSTKSFSSPCRLYRLYPSTPRGISLSAPSRLSVHLIYQCCAGPDTGIVDVPTHAFTTAAGRSVSS